MKWLVFQILISAIPFIYSSNSACFLCSTSMLSAFIELSKNTQNIYSLGSALICQIRELFCELVTILSIVLLLAGSLYRPHYDFLVCHLVIFEYCIIMQLSMSFSHKSQLKIPFI